MKELKVKYSVLPARIINETKRFKIAHYNVMVSLCISAGKSGLVYKTVETIENECPHIRRETIKKTLKDLVNWGYLYKLEPKYMKGQQSKWLTNRYMVVYTPDQPIPKYEELEKEVININKADETVQKELEVQEKQYDEQKALSNLRLLVEGVASISGNTPQYTLPEYIKIMGDAQMEMTREEVTTFARHFLKHYKRNPSLKEVLYRARIG